MVSNGIKVLFAVCAAPKRRFRPYMPDVSKNVNDKDVRKARKAELQRDEAVGYIKDSPFSSISHLCHSGFDTNMLW